MDETKLVYIDVSKNSNKVYRAKIQKVGSGYQVIFSYGRRYHVPQSYVKPDDPVSYEEACRIKDEQVSKKLKKGYKEVHFF